MRLNVNFISHVEHTPWYSSENKKNELFCAEFSTMITLNTLHVFREKLVRKCTILFKVMIQYIRCVFDFAFYLM